jgi:hypothetical protein
MHRVTTLGRIEGRPRGVWYGEWDGRFAEGNAGPKLLIVMLSESQGKEKRFRADK